MQNVAQHKHFTAGGNEIDKQAVVAPFHFRKESTTKTFLGAREFGATNFGSNHFRDGKSQKALSQQDKPLSIEQVRDLLNKNK